MKSAQSQKWRQEAESYRKRFMRIFQDLLWQAFRMNVFGVVKIIKVCIEKVVDKCVLHLFKAWRNTSSKSALVSEVIAETFSFFLRGSR